MCHLPSDHLRKLVQIILLFSCYYRAITRCCNLERHKYIYIKLRIYVFKITLYFNKDKAEHSVSRYKAFSHIYIYIYIYKLLNTIYDHYMSLQVGVSGCVLLFKFV
jgi:hypothetical protein